MRSSLVIVPALALLAACNGDGGTSSDPLAPEEVAGVYELCSLSFQPSNSALPSADLLARVIDTTPPANRPEPSIAMAANGTYDLAYTDQQTQFLEQIRGSIGYREDQITLSFPSSDPNAAALLMPRSLLLNYDAAGHRFAGDASGFPYPVARADYAAAAGISQEGLQSSINGTLQVSFDLEGC
jgi:hypothetical protein